MFTMATTILNLFSSVALVSIILKTSFFHDKFGVTFNGNPSPAGNNDFQLHMIVYLQVAIISQALIFVTRSHGFFFMERPSFALMGAFCVAQLVSSIIAAYANWGFTQIKAISAGWIGIVWVWVCSSSYFCVILIPRSVEHCLVHSFGLDQIRDEGNCYQEASRTSRQSSSSSGRESCRWCAHHASPISCCVDPRVPVLESGFFHPPCRSQGRLWLEV